MTVRWRLLCWQVRQLRLVTLVAMVLSILYVLTCRDPLRFEGISPPAFFILLHCLLITWQQGRVHRKAFSFLYVQGFSRNTLWLNTMLASSVAALAVWLPCALLVWSGIRSDFQELMASYWFPLMADTEKPFLLWCLLAYAVLLPVFHYCWIRAAQPTRGTAGGFAIAAGVVAAAFSIWNSVRVADMPTWIVVLLAGGFVAAAISLAVGGTKLHRQLEVM